MKKLSFIISLFGLCLGLMTASQLRAAVTYWDPQGPWPSGTYTGNMSGTWENKSWSTNYQGAGVSPTNWIESTAACFGVGTALGTPAFSVLMNANHTVGGIFIGSLNPNSCTVTVYGPGIMTLSGLQGFNIHNASDGSLGILTISNTIAGTGTFDPQNNGQIYLYGSNTWTGGTSLGYSGASWNGTVYFVTTNAFGTGNIETSNCLGGALVMSGSSALTITNPLVFPTPTSATLYLVGGSSGVNFAGPVIVNQPATVGIGSVNGPNFVTYSGVMSGSAALTITNNAANAGTLTLAAANSYSGSITIQSGTLALAATGSLSNSPTVTVESPGIFDVSAYSPLPYAPGPKQTLNGFGTVNGDVLIENGARISGGISTAIGTLTNSGSLLLQSGGTNIVYVQNALTGAGVGNSTVNAANNIGVLANSSSPFTIKLDSITGTGAAGAVSNFDRTAPYTWTLATAITGEVTNFDASDFVVDTSAFANSNQDGVFSVSNTGSALVLNYAPNTNVTIDAQVPSGNLTLYVNQYFTLSVTAGGLGPLSYQWFTNGVADTTAGTGSSYPLTAVQLAQSGDTYQCIVTGADTTATNSLVTLTVLPWPSVAYESNILTLQPVAFWPMHEVETPAQGDIETNYGTLGILGTGYYPDWAGNTAGIRRGVSGALADDTDTAVFFTAAANPSTAMYTNELAVPHTSPLSTLNPPFSVECWFYPTNMVSADIWAQNGYEGLNAGAAGGGNGKVGGLRLTWMNGTNTGFQIFTYNNSSALLSPGFSGNIAGAQASPIDNWYHFGPDLRRHHKLQPVCQRGSGNVERGVQQRTGLLHAGLLESADHWHRQRRHTANRRLC